MGAANLISVKSARRHQAMPIGFIDEGTLLLAMADPANVVALDDVQMATGSTAASPWRRRSDIETPDRQAQHAAEHRLRGDRRGRGRGREEDDDAEVTDLRASAEDGPVIKLVNSILGQAVTEGASDIHFEHGDGEMRIRFRVDGVLQEAARVPEADGRRGGLAGQDHERPRHRREADPAGRPRRRHGRGPPHRPARHDPAHPAGGGRLDPHPRRDCGAADARRARHGRRGARQRFESSFRKPYGAVLVTGPTGSGKSTTLYAALQELNGVDKNIVTIEDPVEYRLDGVNQIGVHRKAGLDFATGLRSVLRADPDVIMVGEIRDAETARIAIEAALTGHMVLTTLHTNDAPGAITRLQEMGIESFLTSSAVDCVVAQRLARMLCSHCKRARGRAAGRAAGGRLPGRRRPRGLRAGRLLALPPHRLPRPHRGLLGDGDERAASRRWSSTWRPRPRSPRWRDEEGMLDPARGRPGQGPRRRHQHRGGRARRAARARRRPADLKSEEREDDGRRAMGDETSTSPRCSTRMAEERASDVHLSPGFPPGDARARPDPAAGGVRASSTPQADPRHRLQHPQRRPAQEVRVEQAARPRLRGARRRPLPRQLLLPARLDQRRLPPDPARDPATSASWGCRWCSRSSPASRAGSCSSPGRPARASRPRWRRWSTSSTRSARSTSSRSRTRSSSCTATRAASSTSARSAPTPTTSRLALKSALREDPDVILVGEMRDLETISTALTAAETGHLVFATLHTQSTAQTVDRIIDVFPAHQQQQVRMQLSIAPAGDRHPAAAADRRRRRPGLRLRGAGADTRRPQPDPRGQDPPDLLGDPDLRLDRDADDGRPPRPAGAHGQDHPAAGRAARLGARGAQAPARARRPGSQPTARPPRSPRGDR